MNNWECPICESSKYEVVFSEICVIEGVDKVFFMVSCCQCDLYSLSPRPTKRELLSLYPQNYEPFIADLKSESRYVLRWLRQRHWTIRCQPIWQTKPIGGYLLDMGCATGYFLCEFCRHKHWKGIGVDINKAALQIARCQGLPVLCSELGELRLSSTFFDVVTMWDVIEHVPDPIAVLSEARRVLKPEGLLFLSTPNRKSLQASLWGRHWAGWELPRHLQLFSTEDMQKLLEKTGFEIVGIHRFSTDRFIAVQSVKDLFESYFEKALCLRDERLLSLIALIAWPLFRAIDYTPWASSLFLEARVVREF